MQLLILVVDEIHSSVVFTNPGSRLVEQLDITAGYRPFFGKRKLVAKHRSKSKDMLKQAVNTLFEMPLPDGSSSFVYIFESPTLSDDIARHFPDIKTYLLVNPANGWYRDTESLNRSAHSRRATRCYVSAYRVRGCIDS